jgi:hypothetical protein
MLFLEREDMSTATIYEIPIGNSMGLLEPPYVHPKTGSSVFVVFTSVNWTLKAMEKAREMAKPFGANIVVAAVQVVPYPLSLEEPPIELEFVAKRFQEKALEFSEKIRVEVCLCRDPLAALERILKPNCPVVMGIKKRWWPTPDERLARELRRAGYEIISVETE